MNKIIRLIRIPYILLRHQWRALYIRKDEFHISLEMDAEYVSLLNSHDTEKYINDLIIRRKIVHNETIK